MPIRMRATITSTGDRAGELRTASRLRQDLWAHSPVVVDPDHPLHGTHRDKDGRAYFEFATEHPDEVTRVVAQYGYDGKAEVSPTTTLPGDECANCGNVAGPDLQTVCPNCSFRDITACSSCGREVPRNAYRRISSDLFRCPECRSQVRLRFNSPMFRADGRFNEPLVIVEGTGLS